VAARTGLTTAVSTPRGLLERTMAGLLGCGRSSLRIQDRMSENGVSGALRPRIRVELCRFPARATQQQVVCLRPEADAVWAASAVRH
jgi:hypothetical protein